MGYTSQVGIAVIAEDKKTLRKACQDFRCSTFYAKNQEVCDDLLGLFHEKPWSSNCLLLLFEERLKWHELELAWREFSNFCTMLELPWYFIRIGENADDPVETEWEDQALEENPCASPGDTEEIFEIEVVRKIYCKV